MATTFSPTDERILRARPRARPLASLAAALDLSPDAVRRSAQTLQAAGLLEVQREESSDWEYTPAGSEALAAGLPEMAILARLADGSKSVADLTSGEARLGIGLAMALRAKFIAILPGKQVSLTDAGRAALADPSSSALPVPEQIMALPPARIEELKRRGLIAARPRVSERLTLTSAGEAQIFELAPSSPTLSAHVPSSAPIGPLTRELFLSGEWKNRPLRAYDLATPAQPALLARRHPIARVARRIRSIFLSMGFEEMSAPMVETAFFNFDALFQPQDHPARDLADTFYLPGTSPRPPAKLSQAVGEAHKNGWHYEWSEKVARQMVLRTHTTAVSARTLAESASDPRERKFFSIGKVFRNEATDYKHLAEFFQVEGIISWEGATFGHLLGTLKSFYSALGFSQIRFRPSFFPYTEPSLEIEVFHPERQAWLELGGAGILRPEVCGPLGARYPVLAWGLSLERPLMLASQTEDIRTLYRNDLSWLRSFPLREM